MGSNEVVSFPNGNQRHAEIDGLRGWAALSVLIFHFVWEAFGVRNPGIRNAGTAFILHGSLAVSVFFVLSGDALSLAFLNEGGRPALERIAFKRYLRLTAPIFASCFLTYVVMVAGLNYSHEASRVLHREDWLGTFLTMQPTLRSLISYSIYGVYARHDQFTSYNPMLWTMSFEMLGSVLVFLFLFISERLKRPELVVMALMILFSAMFLGELSFSLYLVHFAVLVSFTSALVLYFEKLGRLNGGGIAVVASLSVLLSFAVASAFRIGEKKFLRALDRLADKCLTKASAGQKPLSRAAQPSQRAVG